MNSSTIILLVVVGIMLVCTAVIVIYVRIYNESYRQITSEEADQMKEIVENLLFNMDRYYYMADIRRLCMFKTTQYFDWIINGVQRKIDVAGDLEAMGNYMKYATKKEYKTQYKEESKTEDDFYGSLVDLNGNIIPFTSRKAYNKAKKEIDKAIAKRDKELEEQLEEDEDDLPEKKN